jgi:Zn-dependent peptidase ImmA (M78 family)
MRQFYLLSKNLNRSSVFFFSDSPPDEPDILREMRRLPGSEIGEESPQLAYRTSLIIDYREMALELFKSLNEEIPLLGIKAKTEEDPEDLATKIRARVGITNKEQFSWHNDRYKALRTWRGALEDSGVLVFQLPFVDLIEMRGFSIPFDPLPIVGMNSKDTVNARIYTIFHELTHIIIGESMLDSFKKELWEISSDFRVENFCNRVSAAVLMPRGDVLEQITSMQKGDNSHWELSEIRRLANRYTVSWEVVTRRLRGLNKISTSSYTDIIDYLRSSQPPPRKDGGNPYSNSISRVGGLLSELAFRAYYENQVTSSELSSLFNLQVKHLDKMEERVFSE